MSSFANILYSTLCPICMTHKHDQEVYQANFTSEDLNPEVFSARRLPDRLHYRMVVCHQCGLMRANPVLSDRALSLLYAQSHGHDLKLSALAAQTYAQYFFKFFPDFPKNRKILEIGCGPGFFLKSLLEKGYHNVHGVEPSHEAVKQSGDIQGLIHTGMFVDGLYPKAYFDVICAFQMFDHLLNPVEFLRNCHGCLQSEGLLFLIMHNIKALPARILGRNCPMIDIEHPFMYDPGSIGKMLQANGYEVSSTFNVSNRYPLAYWFQLLPFPKNFKKITLERLQRSFLGKLSLTLGLGNMGIMARKKEQ